MKTTKIMKNLYAVLITALVVLIISGQSYAQEEKKEMRIKVVKEEDGKKTVIDTTFSISELDDKHKEEIKAILKEAGLEDMEIEMDDLDGHDIKVVHLDGDHDEDHHIKVIKKKGKKGEKGEKEYMVTVIKTDSVCDGKKMKMKVGESSYSYFISDDDEVHEFDMDSDKDKVIIMKKYDDKDGNVFIKDDLIWTGDDEMMVEVIEGEDGIKKVIVEQEDGTKKEYELKEGSGAYMIGEDGELKKMEKDINWISEEEGLHMITVEVDDDGETIIIKSDGETIDCEKHIEKHVIIHDGDHKEKEVEVFIEVIEEDDKDKKKKRKKK